MAVKVQVSAAAIMDWQDRTVHYEDKKITACIARSRTVEVNFHLRLSAVSDGQLQDIWSLTNRDVISGTTIALCIGSSWMDC